MHMREAQDGSMSIVVARSAAPTGVAVESKSHRGQLDEPKGQGGRRESEPSRPLRANKRIDVINRAFRLLSITAYGDRKQEKEERCRFHGFCTFPRVAALGGQVERLGLDRASLPCKNVYT